MSFSSDAKAELCRAKIDKKCCAVAESYGVLLYCNTFSQTEIRIITASADFAARLPKLFRRAFSVGFDVQPDEEAGGKRSFLIRDGEKQPSAIDCSRDPERRRMAVAHGVYDEFADDAENVVEVVVGYLSPRHVEAHLELGVNKMRLKGDADGFVYVALLERLVAEIPDAVP